MNPSSRHAPPTPKRTSLPPGQVQRTLLLGATLTLLSACTSTPSTPELDQGATHTPPQQIYPMSLTSSGGKLKGSMYWPRKAKNPSWWPEYQDGRITDADIRADLQQMKRDLGVNTVRVFLFYDHEYRHFGYIGFTDGKGNFNNDRLNLVSRFIDIAASEGLDVIPTFFMEMEADTNGGFSWENLGDHENYPHHAAYVRWLTNMLKGKSNVRSVNLKNEPDGFGAWADPTIAGEILTWLGKLKAEIKNVAPHLGVQVNCAAFDNTYKKFTTAPTGTQSVYEVSDALFFNSYLWADNGFWEYQVPANIFRYIQHNNTLGKPVVLSEFGWPSYHNDHGMIVPHMQFDNPVGYRPTTPSTPEMQKRAVEESVYWAEKYGFQGVIAWAAFDHPLDGYRNPFGLIDETAQPRPAAASFKQAFTGRYGSTGEAPFSYSDGQINGGKINGIHGTTLLPAGVNLNAGGSYFSEPQRYVNPVTFTLKVRQPTTPKDNGIAVGLKSDSSNKEIELRREEYRKVWRVFINNGEMARTKADRGLSTSAMNIGMRVKDGTLHFSLDGSDLKFYTRSGATYTVTLTASETGGKWRLLAGATTAPVELLEGRAHGSAGVSYE